MKRRLITGKKGREAEMNKYYFDYEGRSESTECEKCAVESLCTPCEACRKYWEAKSRDRQARGKMKVIHNSVYKSKI